MLPALSVKQPWATLIARGEKTIEMRLWMTRYRGPLVICSSKLPVGQGVRGKALCIRFLRHCREMTPADEAAACCRIYPDAKAWEFHPEKRLDLNWFDVRGQRGIFPLLVPDGAFFSPDERDRARIWLQWATENRYLQVIKEFREQMRTN